MAGLPMRLSPGANTKDGVHCEVCVHIRECQEHAGSYSCHVTFPTSWGCLYLVAAGELVFRPAPKMVPTVRVCVHN